LVVPATPVPPIGARLRAARRHHGISVRGLAREIGVSASLISQIETDKSSPSVSTLYAITTALGISIEDLFGDDPADADAGPEIDDEPGGEGPYDGPPGPPAPGPYVREPAFAVLDGASGLTAGGLAAGGLAAGVSDVDAALAGTGGPAAALFGGAVHRTLEPRRERRLGPVVTPDRREVLTLDSGVTWELLGQLPHKHVDFLLITYQPGGSSSSSGLLMRHSGTEFGYVISGELTLTLGFDTHRLMAGDAVSFDSSTPHAYRNESTEPAVGVWFVLERAT
jgi:transcriptional regulator with XRE-family HTH domain/quercetin dioxygenase-like cupin family protein